MGKATEKQLNLLKYWLTIDYLNPAGLPDKANELKEEIFQSGKRTDTLFRLLSF